MGAQLSTNLSYGWSSREQRYLDIKSKADLGRYIKYANKSTLMVINFTKTSCMDAEPPMRKLAEYFPDVKFARVDIDLLQDVVKEFDLKTMPTFLLCKKVDDDPDKGKGAAEVGGGNGSGNRISSANNVKEGNSVVPSAIEDKRTTSIKGGNSVVPIATEGKSADSVKEGNRAAAGATGGKSGTGVERADSAAVSGSKGESTTANAKDGQRKALAPKGENDTSTVKEGNTVKNGDGFAVIKEPSPKRRTVNCKKVFIHEIDRMEGSLEVHELRKKIEYYKNQPTTASFKSTDEFYRYLEKSKPTQLMVINFTTEWCEPCKKAKDPFEKLSKFYEDVKFAKVDVDVLMNIAKELEVTMMPTFLLVKVKKVKEPEKEIIKKDGVQGDHKKKKKTHVLNKRYKMVELDQLVGWNDKKKGELWKTIEKHRHTTT